MFPLSYLNEGRRGKIVQILDCAAEKEKCGRNGRRASGLGNNLTRIKDLGLRVGKTIELLKKGGHGPLLVKVDEARIAIGRRMADKIIITDV